MDPLLLTSIAWLVVRALNAGVTMQELFTKMQETGEMTDELWMEIMDAVNTADERFRNAPGPGGANT